MIDVKELNEQVQALGLNKIGFIAEDVNQNDEWDTYVDPEINGNTFGFDAKNCSFKEDTYKYWDSYRIVKSTTLEGMYNVVLVGRGPAYTTA